MDGDSPSHEELQARLARAEAEIRDLRPLAHAAAAQQRTASALDSMIEGFAILDHDGRFVFVNPAAERFIQKSRAELIGQRPWELFPEAGSRRFGLEYRRAVAENVPVHFEEFYPEPLNAWYEVRAYPSAEGLSVFFRDITERKLAEAYREMGRDVLQLLNEPGDVRASIQRVLAALKTRTGFDAVGIRLQDGDDFPYFAQEGFPEDFLLTENTLTERGADGGVCRDNDGNVSLECTCGLIICGKTDPANPLFTPGGSFLTNDSFPLLDIPPGEDPRRHPRNQCIHHGYASVALVPIRNKHRNVGLIQLNDRRKGCFTLERVELLEGIGLHIGAALMRKQAEEALRERIKEQDCLYGVADLIEHEDSLEKILQGTAELMPRGWFHDDIACARIVLNGQEFKTANFQETAWRQASDIILLGEPAGVVELCYLEERQTRDEGPFLREERRLVSAIAGRLGRVADRKRVEQELERAHNEAVIEKAHLEVVTRALSESEAVVQRANDDLKTANSALRRINETLEARVATRTATLAQRTDQLKALAREVTRAEERERQRVAEVIHDQLQQLLSVARIKLGIALRQVGTKSHQENLSDVDDLIAESLDITRTLTAELSPAILRRSGLAAALRWLGRWYEAQFAITVAVEAEDDADVEEEFRVTLFRSVRELLFNVVKHAGVTGARVQLERGADGRVRIQVSDDGVGFDPEAVRAREGTSGSFGLFSLRERLELLGGQFEVDSAPGRGASFTMIAPLPRRAGPEAPAPAAASTTPLAIAVGIHTGARRRPPRRKKGPA